MRGELMELVKEQGLPLGDMIEPGAGFRIGSPEFEFELAEDGPDGWTHVSREHSLKVESEVRFVGSCALIRRRVENTGGQPSPPIDAIEPLHVVFRQAAGAWRHIYANGGTAEHCYPPMEFRTQECSRAPEGVTIESHPKGRSSNLHLPLLVSLATVAADSEGLFCGMEWSGAWRIRFASLPDGRSSLSACVKVRGLRLEPGESLGLPEVHLGFFEGGPAAGTNALRRHLHQNVCARCHGEPMIPRVSYDHWFGISNEFTVDSLKAQARRAAELGVEVFVQDASWFAGGFPYGVGNWDQVDREKFPNGLEELADYVRGLGMDFGLWVEPERAVAGTSILQQHPDWFVPAESWGERPFHHLNFANREAQDYVMDMMRDLIERLDLRWTRWDYNIEPQPFWEAVDPTLKIQFRYMEGLYRVLDTLLMEHPNWTVEGCASGGRRIDIGTMKRAHTFWISDYTDDPLACRYMQARANRFLPGHLLNSSVAVNAGVGDAVHDDTALLSRMLGKLGFDGRITEWSPELTARMARWVGEFKAIRHLLVQDFYQLLPMPTGIEDWDALEFAGYGGDEAALFVFAGSGGGRRKVPLKGLRDDQEYLVSRRPGGARRRVAGATLQAKGLALTLDPNEGDLWHIGLPR